MESRSELRLRVQGRQSGGVFLTTIHKFTEDTQQLTERTNVICISDEAHRSQTNLDQKVTVTEQGVKRTFALPNTYMIPCRMLRTLDFYQQVIALRPQWAEIRESDEGVEPTETERRLLMPIAKVNLVMTGGKDDEKALYDLLGTKDDRKKLDAQFKNAKSNFKIAIVVDMWLTWSRSR